MLKGGKTSLVLFMTLNVDKPKYGDNPQHGH